MKKKLIIMTVMVFIIAAGMLMLSGCGSVQGQNLEDYMKGQPNMRSSVDAQLNILSPDAKASVLYTEDNKAEVTVQYYAMTDEEIEAIEPHKAEIRCNAILEPVLKQFEEDTGNVAVVVVNVEGHVAGQ